MNALVKIASNEHKLQDLLNKLKQNKGGIKIGFLPGSKYPDGTPVAKVAVIQEFGTSDIPPRPFLYPTVEKHRAKWVDKLGEALRLNDYDGKKALNVIGMIAVGDVKDAIKAVTTPPLKESSIKARNRQYKTKSKNTSTKPLIDTGQMLNSVEFEVT